MAAILGALAYPLAYPVRCLVGWPKKSMKGKKVIITGGASGLGKMMAEHWSKEGANVVVLDLNISQAPKAKNIQAVQFDVCDREKWYDLAAAHKDCALLVLNAGIVQGKSFLETSDAFSLKVMEVNAISHIWACRAFLPAMKERKEGHLVSIASQAGKVGVASLTDYCASKFAAVGLMESIRAELKKEGSPILTTIVNPFFIDTGMFSGTKPSIGGLIPFLKPDYVIKRISDGVAEGWEEINLPWIANVIPLVRLLPIGLQDWAAGVMGFSSSMDTFEGRKDTIKQVKELSKSK